jgi:hypothetical protein
VSQFSGYSTTAPGRSSLHALRPVLILGGFVAIWWALMTGVAHADSTPSHHLVDHLRSQATVATQHHDEPVRAAVRRVHHDVQATTTEVRHQVRSTTRPVTQHVSAAVRKTPLAPVATKVTETIHTTLSETVATTHAVLVESPVGAVDDVVSHTVKNATEKPGSSTGQGNSHSLRHSAKAPATSTASSPSSTSGQPSESSVAADRAPASSQGNGPLDSPFGAPSLPGPCASPSGSGSASSTPVGIIESSLLVLPSVLSDHHTWRHARLPGGPAYQPGSAPD